MDIATGTVYALEEVKVIDLINFSKDIAQLNLGYLTIAVAILGIFVYFNFKSLKEDLNKQERAVDDVKREAKDLLATSAAQSEEILREFKREQKQVLDEVMATQAEQIGLETTNKLQKIEKTLTDRIEEVSEKKDVKLKEIILSEVTNRVAASEKGLTEKLNKVGKEAENDVKRVEEKVKELLVYMYKQQNKFGSVVYAVELLKDSIDGFLEKKKQIGAGVQDFSSTFGWKVTKRLNELLEIIEEVALDEDAVKEIEVELKRISDDDHFTPLAKRIKKAMEPGADRS